ncbi:MAG: hypothetical protein R2827_11360 [Bdellovibrionales bacterium]
MDIVQLNSLDKITKVLFGSDFEDYKVGARDPKLLVALTFVFFPMLIAFAMMSYFELGHIELVYAELIFGFGVFAGLPVYRITKNFDLSANIMLTSGLGIIFSAALVTGGVHSPILYWAPVCPMVAGMVTGKRSVFIWFLILLTTITGLSAFDEVIMSSAYQITDQKLGTSRKASHVWVFDRGLWQ